MTKKKQRIKSIKRLPEYNWFGTAPRPKRNYQPFSFLGVTSQQKQKISSKVSFLGNANPSFAINKPSPLFVKESIKKKKNKLSKWGDADMDGSPNYFDCDPTNFLKDAKPIKEVFKEARYNLGEYLASKAKGAEARTAKVEAQRSKEQSDKSIVAAELQQKKLKDKISKLRRSISARESKGVSVPKEEKKEVEELATQYKSESKKLRKEVDAGRKLALSKIASSQRFAKLEKVALLTGPAKTAASLKVDIDEALAAGKTPTKKTIFAYQKALEKTSIEARAGRLGEALGAGTAMGIATGKGIVKTSKGLSYSKEMLAKSARMKRLTAGAAGILFGPSISAKGFASEPRGRGRPAGPSGEYKIGGKPVYEEEYRQWEAKQNALNRMLPSETQSQTLNPEYLEYIKSQEAERARKAQMDFEMNQAARLQQQTGQEQPAQDMGMEEGMNEPVPSDQAPQTEGLTNEAVQAIEEARRRPYTRAQPDEIKAAQYVAQQKDQVLNAPNFMKGELKAAGGGILTPNGPQIMDAPNVFKGEMRNVYQTGDVPAVRLSERPQTNPYGDEYLEIELGSGKPVVRKRVREKWMTGEAL